MGDEGRDHGAMRRMIWQETFADMVRCMRPDEIIVAMLRLEGLSDGEIGRLLGVDRPVVSMRMSGARRRIARRMPHMKGFMTGRRRRLGRRTESGTPLEHGWVCQWGREPKEGER